MSMIDYTMFRRIRVQDRGIATGLPPGNHDPALIEERGTETHMTETPMPHATPSEEADRRLLENVHPPDWVNPTVDGRYNLVVLGAGTAGLVAAAGAAGMGAKVALVERHLMGGDCLNTGCVPSKAIIRSAHAAQALREAGDFGIRPEGGFEVDFEAVMGRMRHVRAEISPADSARRFTDHYGVDVHFGEARFTGRDRVEVAGQELEFSAAVIATGARAAVPTIPGLSESGFLTNHTVFDLTEKPRRLAILGGGPIGCELAQTFARLGTRVTVIEMMEQFLPREDRDAADLVRRSLERDGVDVRLSTTLARVEASADGKALHLDGPDGESAIVVDEIFVGVGRTPNVEGLDLGRAGVSHDHTGVLVNDHLQTSNPKIYASGDVCLPAKFTHVADFASRAVIQNALFPGPNKKFSSLTLAWATYTDPEIAHVGLYEHEARERGLEVETITIPMSEVDRALAEGDTEGFLKIHVHPKEGTIFGATLVCRRAGDLISEITTAMHAKQGLGDLAGVIHPYPTVADAVRRAADQFNRRKLTPLVARVLERWFAWTR
jgi:pyruvate/2-oxoglutarate dehydrogenase complex dihydrolipoamide dehydrogenase (E3) component